MDVNFFTVKDLIYEEFDEKYKQVGLLGEDMFIFSEQGSKTAAWKSLSGYTNKPLIWYKVTTTCS